MSSQNAHNNLETGPAVADIDAHAASSRPHVAKPAPPNLPDRLPTPTIQRAGEYPSRPSRHWLILVAAGCLLALGAYFVDQDITNWLIQEHVRTAIQKATALPLGASGFLILLAILGAFPNRARLCGGFLAAMLLSTAITHIIKFTVGRARPDMGIGPARFEPLNWLGEYQSFPSGHSSAAIALALLLGLYFPRFRWVFYVSGAWVCFDRVMYNRHYTSDVLAGAAIGILSVYLCLRFLGLHFYRLELPDKADRPAEQ
jgi:membrane-associated phospholipid phosphatase